MEKSIMLPGLPGMVSAARRIVRGMLDNTPVCDDAETIVSELTTNALRHTPSGEPDGEFKLKVQVEDGYTRIEVQDAGTIAWKLLPFQSEDDEGGHGLGIVSTLADGFGAKKLRRDGGYVVWAELRWDVTPPP